MAAGHAVTAVVEVNYAFAGFFAPVNNPPEWNRVKAGSAGSSSLQYDIQAGQYKYVWKTARSWSGTCRKFELKLRDNESDEAYFTFK